MLPQILNQIGPEGLMNLKKGIAGFGGREAAGTGGGGDDDVPEVETFESA